MENHEIQSVLMNALSSRSPRFRRWQSARLLPWAMFDGMSQQETATVYGPLMEYTGQQPYPCRIDQSVYPGGMGAIVKLNGF